MRGIPTAADLNRIETGAKRYDRPGRHFGRPPAGVMAVPTEKTPSAKSLQDEGVIQIRLRELNQSNLIGTNPQPPDRQPQNYKIQPFITYHHRLVELINAAIIASSESEEPEKAAWQELAEVVTGWPKLASEVRERILRLVRDRQ